MHIFDHVTLTGATQNRRRPNIVHVLRATHSWLCDPDHLLTPDEQSVLESRLMKLRDSTEHRCPDGRKYFYQVGHLVLL